MKFRSALAAACLPLFVPVAFAGSEVKKPQGSPGPLACKLTPPELAQRRVELEAEVFHAILEKRELGDGYGFRFPAGDVWIGKLNQFIVLERECCSFFRFELVVEPEHGPVWLNLRGGPEVKQFIEAALLARAKDSE
jgi:hypothetical protein